VSIEKEFQNIKCSDQKCVNLSKIPSGVGRAAGRHVMRYCHFIGCCENLWAYSTSETVLGVLYDLVPLKHISGYFF